MFVQSIAYKYSLFFSIYFATLYIMLTFALQKVNSNRFIQ